MRLGSALVALLSLLSIPAVAARGGMPTPLTDRGATIESIYFQIFVAGTIVFLFVMAWLLYAMWRFRADGGAGRETFEIERENLKLEIAWIGIPLIVVLWVGAISYAGLIDLDEPFEDDEVYMDLNITGYQWTWEADYGSGISLFSDPSPLDGSVADKNVFKIPAGVPIELNITSGDVIHAFHIMDSNWATVGLVDANPSGPHEHTTMTIQFPLGEYHVQCREMCFNPGHAYMRARIEAVSMAEFGSWMEEQKLTSGASFTQGVDLSIDDEGKFEPMDGLILAKGARAIVTVSNDAPTDQTIVAPPFEFRTVDFHVADATVSETMGGDITIRAESSATFSFEVTEAGTYSFATGSSSHAFEVIEAVPVNVELGDFFIRPQDIMMEAGQTYLLNIRNVGATTHNLYIGEDLGDVSDDNLNGAFTETFGPGEARSLLFTPSETGSLASWCNVAGHIDLGMVGKVTVT